MLFNRLNNLQDKEFENYNDTLKYLMMGNSYNCINPKILNNSFNYSSPNENYIQTYYKLKSIIEKSNKILEYVILPFDITYFCPFAAKRFKFDSYWVKYLNYLEIGKIKNDKYFKYKWITGKFFSYAGNYKDIQLTILYHFKVNENENDIVYGYRAPRNFKNFSEETNKMQLAQNKVDLYFTEYKHTDKSLRIYFKKILDICIKNNIKVILIKMPITKEFYTKINERLPVKTLDKEIEPIYSNYTNITQLNYLNLFFEHPEYFFNEEHLNPKGADKISGILKNELKKKESKFKNQTKHYEYSF